MSKKRKQMAKRNRRKKQKQSRSVHRKQGAAPSMLGNMQNLLSQLGGAKSGEPISFPPDFPPFPAAIQQYGERLNASLSTSERRNKLTRHWEAGTAFFNREQYQQAIPELQRSLALMTQSDMGPEAVYNLAQCYANLGKKKAFYATMNFYIELKPKDPDPYFGLAYAALLDEKYEKVIRLTKEGRKRVKGRNRTGLINMARAYAHLGQYDESIKTLKEAIRIDPNWADAHRSMGAAYEDIGEIELAKAAYRRAAQLNPAMGRQLERLEQGIVFLGGPASPRSAEGINQAWVWSDEDDDELE